MCLKKDSNYTLNVPWNNINGSMGTQYIGHEVKVTPILTNDNTSSKIGIRLVFSFR